MKLNLIESKEILDFEKEIGHELVVNERNINAAAARMGLERFTASFEKAEVMRGGALHSEYGTGCTIDMALRDYCRKVSGERIAFNAYTDIREEITFPNLVHTQSVAVK